MSGPNFENSFIQQCLLSSYYVPATILATEDVTVSERAKTTLFLGSLHLSE